MTRVKKLGVFLGFFLIFFEFLVGGPGPGQAPGTVWISKSIQNPNEKIVLQIGVIFQGHSYRIRLWMTLENHPYF